MVCSQQDYFLNDVIHVLNVVHYFDVIFFMLYTVGAALSQQSQIDCSTEH